MRGDISKCVQGFRFFSSVSRSLRTWELTQIWVFVTWLQNWSLLPNSEANNFVLSTISPRTNSEGWQRDILTVWIHFKIWQWANYRAAGRQIKLGPSQQVVLGQIGRDSVQPLSILPAQGGQDGTHKLSTCGFRCMSVPQLDFQVSKV